MGMDQYLLIPFLVGWTSIYQLFWCSPGVQGFDTLPYKNMLYYYCTNNPSEIRVVGFPAGICRYKVKKWGGLYKIANMGQIRLRILIILYKIQAVNPIFVSAFFLVVPTFWLYRVQTLGRMLTNWWFAEETPGGMY